MTNKIRNFSLILLPLAAIFGAACGGSTTTTNTNANLTIANTNVNVTTNGNTVSIGNNAVSTTVTTSSTGGIESKEPEQYQAQVALKFETSGAQKVATQPLRAEVARNGADRRMEFAMPNGEKLIYLETGGKQLLVMPQRKQYAELTKEALGFEVRSLMMPETIVKQLNNLKGIERFGEEKLTGATRLNTALPPQPTRNRKPERSKPNRSLPLTRKPACRCARSPIPKRRAMCRELKARVSLPKCITFARPPTRRFSPNRLISQKFRPNKSARKLTHFSV
jgi:hypothetical protein